jgi:hypothetical protein
LFFAHRQQTNTNAFVAVTIEPTELSDQTEEEAAANLAIDGVDLFLDDPKEWTIDIALLEIRNAMSKVRKICRFVKNSTLSKGKLNEFHERNRKLYDELIVVIEQDNLTTGEHDDIESDDIDAHLDCFAFYGKHGDGNLRKKVKKLILDVRTRWNSAYAMIQNFLRVQVVIKQYMEWYWRPKTQKTHFANTKNPLQPITDRDWAILYGLAYLLQPFALATDQFSADKTSTICGVAPAINFLGNNLQRQTLLDKPSTEKARPGQCRFKHDLYDEHEGRDYFDDVIKLLKKCQMHLRDKYHAKFKDLMVTNTGTRGKMAWLTLLHPKEYSLWMWRESWNDQDTIIKLLKDDFEKEVFKIALRHERKRLKTADYLGKISNSVEFAKNRKRDVPATPPGAKHNSLYGMYSPVREETLADMIQKQTTTIGDTDDFEKKLASTVNVQCSLYFQDLALDPHAYGGFKKFDLLQYWQKKTHNCKYYWVLKCAQKWLAVPAMSTPSERVWSICGVIDNPKRGRLDGLKLEAQAMINNNYQSLRAYHTKIETRSIDLMKQKKDRSKVAAAAPIQVDSDSDSDSN